MRKKIERDTLAESGKRWLTPVPTPKDLPTTDVQDGDICFVTSESSSWAYTDGSWVAKQSPRA